MSRLRSLPIALLGTLAWAGPQQMPQPAWLAGVELEPTYTGGAGLVFDRRCTSCHRREGLGPMSFETFADIREWSVGTQTPMEDAVALGLMPPWPPGADAGAFANDARLSRVEIDLLERWVEAGYPRGDGDYDGWSDWSGPWGIGPPDAVWTLPERTVDAGVTNDVVEHVVETGFAEDRWIVAAAAVPGDPRIVSAIDAWPLGQYRAMNADARHPAGAAMLLPAGARVTVRVRYDNPTRDDRTDVSRLGVVFAPDPAAITTHLRVAPMRAEPFRMAPEEKGREVTARFVFPADGAIHALMPAMELRGTTVRYHARTPTGDEHALLSIPDWSPLWKLRYTLAEPLAVPAGTVVEAFALFDNSFDNLRNPDPWSAMDSEETGDTFEGWLTYALDGGR